MKSFSVTCKPHSSPDQPGQPSVAATGQPVGQHRVVDGFEEDSYDLGHSSRASTRSAIFSPAAERALARPPK
jgi:hypothetical protein